MFDERLSKEYSEVHKFDPTQMEYEDGDRAYPPHPGMHRHTGADYWHDRRTIHRAGSDAEAMHKLHGLPYKKGNTAPAKPKEKPKQKPQEAPKEKPKEEEPKPAEKPKEAPKEEPKEIHMDEPSKETPEEQPKEEEKSKVLDPKDKKTVMYHGNSLKERYTKGSFKSKRLENKHEKMYRQASDAYDYIESMDITDTSSKNLNKIYKDTMDILGLSNTPLRQGKIVSASVMDTFKGKDGRIFKEFMKGIVTAVSICPFGRAGLAKGIDSKTSAVACICRSGNQDANGCFSINSKTLQQNVDMMEFAIDYAKKAGCNAGDIVDVAIKSVYDTTRESLQGGVKGSGDTWSMHFCRNNALNALTHEYGHSIMGFIASRRESSIPEAYRKDLEKWKSLDYDSQNFPCFKSNLHISKIIETEKKLYNEMVDECLNVYSELYGISKDDIKLTDIYSAYGVDYTLRNVHVDYQSNGYQYDDLYGGNKTDKVHLLSDYHYGSERFAEAYSDVCIRGKQANSMSKLLVCYSQYLLCQMDDPDYKASFKEYLEEEVGLEEFNERIIKSKPQIVFKLKFN